jgi:hypothetical protein
LCVGGGCGAAHSRTNTNTNTTPTSVARRGGSLGSCAGGARSARYGSTEKAAPSSGAAARNGHALIFVVVRVVCVGFQGVCVSRR